MFLQLSAELMATPRPLHSKSTTTTAGFKYPRTSAFISDVCVWNEVRLGVAVFVTASRQVTL